MIEYKFVVNLPWPEKILWPNRSKHWAAHAAAKKAAKEDAYTASRGELNLDQQWPSEGAPERLRVTILFQPPDKIRRDMDNMHSAMKSAQDGIFLALDMDDSLIREVLLQLGDKVKGGNVQYIVEEMK